jgi:hypothetical protein
MDSIKTYLILFITGVISYIYMKKQKDKLALDEINENGLQGKNLLIVCLLCTFAPFVASTIFYYGWKKKLPKKAKQANRIGLLTIIIVFVVSLYLYSNKLQ